MTALTNYFKKVNPDVVFTFDPRHGSSCHLDHRAVGMMVTEVVNRIKGNLDSLYYPEAFWSGGPVSENQVGAWNETIIPDDTQVLLVDTSKNWLAVPDVLAIHKSQFRDTKNDFMDAFNFTPADKKISPILSAKNLSMTDKKYQNLCPYNDKYWPGQYPKLSKKRPVVVDRKTAF